MAFKIYYENGKRVCSWEMPRDAGREIGEVDMAWGTDTPTRGVVAIIQDDDIAGWTLLAGHDYYVWWQGQWVGANYHQMLDYLIESGKLKIQERGLYLYVADKWRHVDDTQLKLYLDKSGMVLTGRMVTAKMEEDILQEAAYDAEFAVKSDWRMGEHKVKLRAPGVARNYAKDW